MVDNFNIMYNEVYSFLNLLGNEYIEKLPNNVYEYIKKERIPDYNANINPAKNISSQISKNTLAFISYLNLKYWTTSEEQQELITIYKENDIKKESLKQKYNPEKIFKKTTSIKPSENKALIKEEQNWHTKLKNFILSFFNKIKYKKRN